MGSTFTASFFFLPPAWRPRAERRGRRPGDARVAEPARRRARPLRTPPPVGTRRAGHRGRRRGRERRHRPAFHVSPDPCASRRFARADGGCEDRPGARETVRGGSAEPDAWRNLETCGERSIADITDCVYVFYYRLIADTKKMRETRHRACAAASPRSRRGAEENPRRTSDCACERHHSRSHSAAAEKSRWKKLSSRRCRPPRDHTRRGSAVAARRCPRPRRDRVAFVPVPVREDEGNQQPGFRASSRPRSVGGRGPPRPLVRRLALAVTTRASKDSGVSSGGGWASSSAGSLGGALASRACCSRRSSRRRS